MRDRFPSEIKLAAYDLFMQELPTGELVKRLETLSKKKFKRRGPKQRTIEEWRRSPDWKAEKALRIQKLKSKRAEEYADKAHEALDELIDISDSAVNQLREWIKQGVKPSPASLYNTVYLFNQEKARRLKGTEKPIDLTDILKAALDVFIKHCSKKLGKAFDDALDELLADTAKDLQEGADAS